MYKIVYIDPFTYELVREDAADLDEARSLARIRSLWFGDVSIIGEDGAIVEIYYHEKCVLTTIPA